MNWRKYQKPLIVSFFCFLLLKQFFLDRYLIDEYLYNLLNMLLIKSEILLRERSFKIAFKYLKESYEMSKILQQSKVEKLL